MGTLRVTSSNVEGEFVLEEGANKVGRSRDNQIRIPHKSVSRHHCIVTEEDGKLRIKDLASTYGCYINEDKVRDGIAEEGDIIRFGRVRFVYEGALAEADANASSDSLVAVPRKSAPPADPGDDPEEESSIADAAPASSHSRLDKNCEKHPSRFISLICPKCHLRYCEECVNVLEMAGRQKKYCPYCKEQCRSLESHFAAVERAQERANRNVYQCLGEILVFPLTAAGILLLLLGTLFHVILDFAAQYSLPVALVASTYLLAYLQKIITATALGEEELPGWPDFGDWLNDFLRPLGLFLTAAAAAFLPAIIAALLVAYGGLKLNQAVTFPLVMWGMLYLPMALVSSGARDSFLAANPLNVISGIVKLGGKYILGSVLLLIMVIVRVLAANYLDTHVPIPFLPEVLIGLLTLYFVAVEVRYIGLMYYLSRRNLG